MQTAWVASAVAKTSGGEQGPGVAGAAQLSGSRPGAGTTARRQHSGSGSQSGRSTAGVGMIAQSQHSNRQQGSRKAGAATTALVALQLVGGRLSQGGAGLLPDHLAAAVVEEDLVAARALTLAPEAGALTLAAVAGLTAPQTLATHVGVVLVVGVLVVAAGHVGSAVSHPTALPSCGHTCATWQVAYAFNALNGVATCHIAFADLMLLYRRWMALSLQAIIISTAYNFFV
jgi:hypothetical protein